MSINIPTRSNSDAVDSSWFNVLRDALEYSGSYPNFYIATADYTADMTESVIGIDASSNTVTVSLPPAADNEGKKITVMALDVSNTAKVEELSVGDLKTFTAVNDTVTYVSNGTNWLDISGGASLAAHEADTSTHGVTEIVGTSESQTLTTKVIDADNNTISNLAHGSEVDNPASGVHGVVGDVVGTTDTQTLTNKTLNDCTLGGTTTIVNSTNLEVSDPNILINDGGNDTTADGAGLTVERTGTDGTFVYNSARAAKWDADGIEIVNVTSQQNLVNKELTFPEINENVDCTATSTELNQLDGVTVGGTSSGDIVTLDGAQIITNKYIDGATASNTNAIKLPQNTTTNLDALTNTKAVIAYDTDLDTIVVNDGTGWNEVSGGGGTADESVYGILNAEDGLGITEWTVNNGSALALATSETAPLKDTTSFIYTMSAVGDKWQSPTITVSKRAIDAVWNILKTASEYDGDTNDIAVRIYDVSNSTVLQEHFLEAGSGLRDYMFNLTSTTLEIRFEFEVMTFNSGKVWKFDSLTFTDNVASAAAIQTKSETTTYTGYVSKNGSGFALLKTEKTDTSNTLFTVANTDHTRYTFNKRTPFAASAGYSGTDSDAYLILYNSSDVQILVTAAGFSSNGQESFSMNDVAEIGDYLVYGAAGTPSDAINTHFSVTATAINDHLLVSDTRQQAHVVASLKLEGNAGEGITANTENIPFAGTSDFWTTGTGLTDNYYTVQSGGTLVQIDGVARYSASADLVFNLYLNNTLYKRLNFSNDLTYNTEFSYTSEAGEFTANDKLSFRISTNRTLLNDITLHYLNITESYLPPEDEKTVVTTVALPMSEKQSFSARIANNGTATITSVDADFIESVNRSALGVVDIVWKTGIFTVAPAVAPALEVGPNRDISATAITAFGCTIYSQTSSSSTSSDVDFSIKVSKQGADAADGERVYVGTVAPYRTMFIKDVKPSGTNGGTFTSGAWQTRELNNISGDIFGSLSSYQITLPEGEYLIGVKSPAFQVNSHKTRLWNVTNSVVLLTGSSEQASSVVSMVTKSEIAGKIIITAPTTIEVQHYGETTRSVDGLGLESGSSDSTNETYTTVEITKLK